MRRPTLFQKERRELLPLSSQIEGLKGGMQGEGGKTKTNADTGAGAEFSLACGGEFTKTHPPGGGKGST